MRRCLVRVCAGMLLLVAVGCMSDTFLGRQIVVNGPMVVVPGSVSEVSAKLQEGLSQAGMMLSTNRVGSDYRIVSRSQSGKVFCIHMRQAKDKDAGSSKTQVRVQWDRGGDEELWQLVQKILNTSTEEGTGASTEK